MILSPLIIAGLLLAPAAISQTKPWDSSHVVRTVREAHSLSAEQASHGYPVRLRAVVTYYDSHNDGRNASLFIRDNTAGIYVLFPADWHWSGKVPHAGSVINIVGVTAPGDYASIIARPQIEVIGESATPIPAKSVSFTHLSTGIEDAQYVELEGVVRSVTHSTRRVTLNIAMADGAVGATTVSVPNTNYDSLIDAKIRIQGSIGTLFNQSRQMVGTHLLFPDLNSVVVEEPSPANVFALPVKSIDGLSRFTPTGTLPHRVHVRGPVTLQWPGAMVCVQDGTRGICAKTLGRTHLELGQIADVAGFVVSGGYRPMLVDSVFRSLGGSEPVEGIHVTRAEALQGQHDSEVVQIDGDLIGRDLVAGQPTLLLSSGGYIFPVMLQKNAGEYDFSRIGIGSKLRITGVCSVVLDAERMATGTGSAITESFHVLIRSPEDLKILAIPSWWTPARTLSGLAGVLVVTGIVFVWVVVLRKQVEQQTKVIRDSEEKFRHMALHDGLTGLPTRRMLQERLKLSAHKMRRFNNGIALLMLDLDDFKGVNDTLGHDGGDETLRVMAKRIEASIRATDLAARVGGDEFVVFLDDLVTPGHAETVAEKIVSSLSVPIPIGEHTICVSVSIGVCEIFEQGLDSEALLKRVDLAMYDAKAKGRNRFEVFTPEMAEAAMARQRIKEGLIHALDQHELELYYQPIVSAQGSYLMGFEALLRWNSESLGFVMPSDFIPVAEESGMIIPIGEWVLNEACREICSLEQRMGRKFDIAINLSPRQLLQRDLPSIIRQTLQKYGRVPGSLKMEITESILVSDSDTNRHALTAIRDLGVQIAIDDFGIGFSSLSYISRFPVDWIKIDRSFISNCTSDPASLAVVRAIIAMARSLDIRVIAEGVETLDQSLLVARENCHAIQGYFFSRPVPYNELLRLLSCDLNFEESSNRISIASVHDGPAIMFAV